MSPLTLKSLFPTQRLNHHLKTYISRYHRIFNSSTSRSELYVFFHVELLLPSSYPAQKPRVILGTTLCFVISNHQVLWFLLTEYHCVQTLQYESPVNHWNQYCYLTIVLLPRTLASNKCIGFKENSGSTLSTVLLKQTLMKLQVKQPKGRLGKLLKTCLLDTSSYLTISLFFP